MINIYIDELLSGLRPFLKDTTGLISGKMKIEDSLEEITNLFCECGWTDRLSVLLPVIYGGT
jgi:hypothetical protein